MRICIVAEYYPPINMGGAEVCLGLLVEELSKIKNLEIVVVTPNYTSFKTVVQRKRRLTIIRFKSLRSFLYKKRKATIPMYHVNRALFDLIIGHYMYVSAWEIRRQVKKVLRKYKVEVLHANNLESIFALSKLKTSIPKIAHLRDFRIFSIDHNTFTTKNHKETIESIKNTYKTNTLLAFLLCVLLTKKRNKLLLGFDHYIAINDFIKTCAEKKGVRNIEVIHDPTDDRTISRLTCKQARKKLSLPKDRRLVLFVGSLNEYKGAQFLPYIIERNPELIFVLCGRGPYYDIIKKKGFSNVVMRKDVDPREIMHYYKACDVFLFPQTIQVGYGKVAVEAMKSGLPIVCFKISGIDELLEHRKTCMLAQYGNKDDLNNQLRLLLRNTELQKKLVRNANKRAGELFNIKTITKLFIKLIRQDL